ncbi:flavodoxin [Paraliobacillus quinghaiensis]|uniref:Flavodoxin n=1 Tax=Paraliobacillus quinghaiensis TaxID=470815 RepID=A0A917WTE6_9BACI|nr:flavodoxin domain-containing protein [Paraliobacillus quinghaiensis]GGM27676.1 flavodoxin [Paraliobacillus quinghaiensis]
MQTCIIYMTKHGATKQASFHLAKKLPGDIQMIDLKNEPCPNIEGFDNIIIGGSIYMGNIQKQLKQFLQENLPILLRKKVGLFLCAGHPDPKTINEQFQNAFPAALLHHACAKARFGYTYDFYKLNAIERMIVKKIVGIKQSTFQLSTEKIEEFATQFKRKSTHKV